MGAFSNKGCKHTKPPNQGVKHLKILTIGDGCVGKTCALISFTSGEFPHDLAYTPTIFENYTSHLSVNGMIFNLDLWDTAGQEDYDATRTLSYNQTDIFMVMFSIDNLVSFSNIEHKWIPDLEKYFAQQPYNSTQSKFILIGTKIDLRKDEKKETQVSIQQGEALASKLGAVGYLEVSALSREGLMHAFEQTCLFAIAKGPK